jgi:release factor glutamine methyltransferase
MQGSWYEALDQNSLFDIIVSNPPYIADQDPHLIQGDLRFEPSTALTDFANGLSCLEIIISGAAKYLKSGGLIAVEHGFDQSEAVEKLMSDARFLQIDKGRDLAGLPRTVTARKAHL